MTRGQRRAHLVAWLILAPLLVAALVWALVDHASIPASAHTEPRDPGSER